MPRAIKAKQPASDDDVEETVNVEASSKKQQKPKCLQTIRRNVQDALLELETYRAKPLDVKLDEEIAKVKQMRQMVEESINRFRLELDVIYFDLFA
jgi:hypothetical protein